GPPSPLNAVFWLAPSKLTFITRDPAISRQSLMVQVSVLPQRPRLESDKYPPLRPQPRKELAKLIQSKMDSNTAEPELSDIFSVSFAVTGPRNSPAGVPASASIEPVSREQSGAK